MKAVIYARVSTEEQAKKGFSLPTQIEACYVYAHDKNYDVVGEFKDDFTGTKLNRPGLNDLRDFIAENDVQVLVVYDIDRLSRSLLNQMLLEDDLKKSGVEINYVLGHYPDTDEGTLLKNIRSSIAEYERGKILERSKRGKIGKAKSGSVLVGARPPYGYSKIKKDKLVTFDIIPEEAAIVRMVFNLFLYGLNGTPPLSMNKIAKKLSDMRIPTRGDTQNHVAKKLPKCIWQPATVNRILSRHAYTGTWFYGKTKCVNGKQVPRDKSEWISVDVPQIIDPEEFHAAQELKRNNIEMSKRSTKHKYLMGRRLKCGKCGYSYVGRTRRKVNQYYYCKGREQVHKVCDMPTLRSDHIENAAWEWVSELLLNPKYLKQGLEELTNSINRENDQIKESITSLEELVSKKESKLEKLLDIYLENELDIVTFKKKQASVKDDIRKIKDELREYQAQIRSEELSEDEIQYLMNSAAEVRIGINNADFNKKREIIDLLDVRGVIKIEEGERIIELTCKLGKQQRSLAQTSRLSNTGGIRTTIYGFLPMDQYP